MAQKFIEKLVLTLNTHCENKDSKSFVEWTSKDLNLDITKCRNHCIIENGYVWNGMKLCEMCNKILHENLDKLNKTQYELVLDIINSDEKILVLNDSIKKLDEKIDSQEKSYKLLIENLTNLQANLQTNHSSEIQLIKTNDAKYINLINNEQKYLDSINGKLDDFINIFDKKVNELINKKLNNNIINQKDNNIINQRNNNIINKNNINDNKYASIKIFDILRVGGIGMILRSNTISNGKVRSGYSYQNNKGTVIFRIKGFENNFCAQGFEYPDSDILILPQFIKGDSKMIDLYDEFYFIELD